MLTLRDCSFKDYLDNKSEIPIVHKYRSNVLSIMNSHSKFIEETGKSFTTITPETKVEASVGGKIKKEQTLMTQ